MKSKRLAVLLTVHNRKNKTLNSLRRLFDNELNFELEVYITDDGCTDGTQEAVLLKFPEVKIVEGDGALYWNRGMHAAWKEAAKNDVDYFLWLNDDTLLFSDALKRLLDASNEMNDGAIIVGSTCDENEMLTYGGRKSDKKHTIIAPDDSLLIKCQTFNGNVVLIPRSVFSKVGFNDPYFRHSFGDIEYGLRACKLGVDCYIAPGFYGSCNRNNPIPLFRRKNNSLFKRYKLLYSPLGFNPLEDFYLNRKYYPLHKAVLWFLKLHLNVLFTVDHTKFNK